MKMRVFCSIFPSHPTVIVCVFAASHIVRLGLLDWSLFLSLSFPLCHYFIIY